MLMGMRSGVQKVAGTVTGAGSDDSDAKAPRTGLAKVWSVAGNVLSAVLVIAAVAIFLKRCGVVKF